MGEMTDVLFVGTSHRIAGLDVRASLAGATSDPGVWLANARRLVPAVGELLLLSTCHRVECYGVASDLSAADAQLRAALGAPSAEATALVSRIGVEAIRHLARVACGLDSVIVGEAEIAGQIRRAADVAQRAGVLGPCLQRVVAGALRASGRARAETSIGHGVTSVASAAVSLALELLGSLEDRTVLVAGAGQAGRQALARLVRMRPARLFVASRSARHAAEAASTSGAEVIALADVPDYLASLDLIVAALHAPVRLAPEGAVVDRTARPLVALDLSVPRALDPAVGAWPGVTLRTVDDLGDLARRAAARRLSEVPRVERIADEEAARTHQLVVTRAVRARGGGLPVVSSRRR